MCLTLGKYDVSTERVLRHDLSQAILELEYETAHFDTLPDRMKYNAAARWRIRSNHSMSSRADANMRKKIMATYCKNSQSTSLPVIEAELNCDCYRGITTHTCLDAFRQAPNIVRTWRILWRSLPPHSRRESLLVMYTVIVRSAAADDPNKLIFPFLGMRVCKTAFRTLTQIGSSSLTQARQHALMGHKSCLSKSEFGCLRLIQNTNKPKLYLDARMWLTHLGDQFGDHSPMDLDTYLPKGRKSYYHCMYIASRKSCQMLYASLNVFLEAWRIALPWLKVTAMSSMFVHCGVCDYLKDQIDRCPRHHKELMQAFIDRLGQHFDFQSAQRLAMDRVGETCDQSAGKCWMLKIDKMDQNALWLPLIWALINTAFFRDDSRVQIGLIGSWWSGLLRSAPIHVRSIFDDCEHGSEMQFSTLILNFWEKVKAEHHVPEEWAIGADNTPKETNNKYVCWGLIWLLCVMIDTPL